MSRERFVSVVAGENILVLPDFPHVIYDGQGGLCQRHAVFLIALHPVGRDRPQLVSGIDLPIPGHAASLAAAGSSQDGELQAFRGQPFLVPQLGHELRDLRPGERRVVPGLADLGSLGEQEF
jgi:hypothetical protein